MNSFSFDKLKEILYIYIQNFFQFLKPDDEFCFLIKEFKKRYLSN